MLSPVKEKLINKCINIKMKTIRKALSYPKNVTIFIPNFGNTTASNLFFDYL